NALGTPEAPLPIIPGMVATVEILTGVKSVLDYLVKPARLLRDQALRERCAAKSVQFERLRQGCVCRCNTCFCADDPLARACSAWHARSSAIARKTRMNIEFAAHAFERLGKRAVHPRAAAYRYAFYLIA